MDTFFLDDRQAEALGAALETVSSATLLSRSSRSHKAQCSATATLVFILYERSTSQTFVCSRKRFLEVINSPSKAFDRRHFIDVSGSMPAIVGVQRHFTGKVTDRGTLQITTPPSDVISAVQSLLASIASPIPCFTLIDLISDDRPHPPLVSLAGLLLDYPIVYYVGPSGKAPALDGKPLHLIVADLISESPPVTNSRSAQHSRSRPLLRLNIRSFVRHRFLSFSVPASLCPSASSISASEIVAELQATLSSRLDSAKTSMSSVGPLWTKVEVRIEATVTLDRVAL